jgi:hypothetical protein
LLHGDTPALEVIASRVGRSRQRQRHETISR